LLSLSFDIGSDVQFVRFIILTKNYFFSSHDLLVRALQLLSSCQDKSSEELEDLPHSSKKGGQAALKQREGAYRLLYLWLSLSFEDLLSPDLNALINPILSLLDVKNSVSHYRTSNTANVNISGTISKTDLTPILTVSNSSMLAESSPSASSNPASYRSPPPSARSPQANPPERSPSPSSLAASSSSSSLSSSSSVPTSMFFSHSPASTLFSSTSSSASSFLPSPRSLSKDEDCHRKKNFGTGSRLGDSSRSSRKSEKGDPRSASPQRNSRLSVMLNPNTSSPSSAKSNRRSLMLPNKTWHSDIASTFLAYSQTPEKDPPQDQALLLGSVSMEEEERIPESYYPLLKEKLIDFLKRRTRTSLNLPTDPMDNVPFYSVGNPLAVIQSAAESFFSGSESPNAIAAHFLLWSKQIQRNISESDLILYPIAYKNGVPPESPIAVFTTFLNDLSRWAEVLVLAEWEPADRAKRLEFFISLLESLMAMRCYSVCMGVVMGLCSAHIERF
jgi:hypothetical protein